MSKRKTQHRAARDTNNKENSELKKTIKELKRKVSRLEKQVEQGIPLQQDTEEEDAPTAAAVPAVPNGPVCKKCGDGDLRDFTTPSGKTVMFCGACKFRQP